MLCAHRWSDLNPFGRVPGTLGYVARCRLCGEVCAALALGVDYADAEHHAQECAFALAKQLFAKPPALTTDADAPQEAPEAAPAA